MRPCVIVCPRPVGQEMKRYVLPGAFVIAADAGWRRAKEIGVEPDLVLGDFDSSGLPEGIAHIVLPAEKDDTDTFYAARVAVEKGFDEVVILGGTGGRADHTMANYATLLYLAQNGVRGCMADEQGEVFCRTPGRFEVDRRPGCYLSVFAMGGAARGVTLEGVKYPLHDALLLPEYPLGVSNEFAAGRAVVSHTEGNLLVFITQMD